MDGFIGTIHPETQTCGIYPVTVCQRYIVVGRQECPPHLQDRLTRKRAATLRERGGRAASQVSSRAGRAGLIPCCSRSFVGLACSVTRQSGVRVAKGVADVARRPLRPFDNPSAGLLRQAQYKQDDGSGTTGLLRQATSTSSVQAAQAVQVLWMTGWSNALRIRYWRTHDNRIFGFYPDHPVHPCKF